ncbi:MAG: nuclear transport factor 2 family protein [Crenarchaeota archaeon]|nr:nuclear transport factor 2 family protein [Thermoproteota archaeon]MDA1125055.1 nuclear transport factor 2 family protein [Thermoproteota archaeon]
MLETWVNKIRTNDPKQVVSLYHNDGLLLGTFSDIELKGHDLILKYFENLLKSQVYVEIVTQHKHETESLMTNSGLYNFIVDGKTVNARFSFVFIKTGDDWKILSHHSSVLPESH